MALIDKNILITPNTGQVADPKIVFSGADAYTGAQNLTLQVYPTNNGTLSFEGSSGQLFSITNSMSGTIYSVNDISGIPSIEVLDTGLVKLAQYSGNVLLGTGTDNGTDKLQVNGSILGTVLKSTVATGTSPLTITSTTLVTNLNADLHEGMHASNTNIASTIVARDASGNFSAGTITAALSGNAATAASAFRAISAGSYGSGEVYGSNGGWSGIRFNTPNSVFMVRDTDSYSGIYKSNSTWVWAFNESGSLVTGTVPWTSVSGRPTAVSSFTNDSGYITSSALSPYQLASTAITTSNIGSQSVNYAASAGSCTGNAATATNASYSYNYTQGFNSNWDTDFQNAPAGSTILRGDTSSGSSTGGPGGTWWFQQNMRHTNSSNYWGVQVAWGWEDNANILKTRNVQGGSFGGWVTYLNSSNYTSYNSFSQVYATDWFRSYNATGWYNQTYAVGIYATEAGNVRTYNGANFIAAGNLTANSDERLKENWRNLPVDFVEQLSGVKCGIYDRIDTEFAKTQIGVSAQSLQNVMPNAIIEDSEGILSVAYGNAALVSAVELAKEVMSLKAEVTELKNLVANLLNTSKEQ